MEQPWKLQVWWYFLLVMMLMAGLALFFLNPQFPQEVQRLSACVRPDAWSTLLGIYLIAIVLAHLVTFYSARVMALLLQLRGPDTPADLWSPTLVGICESIMYPTVLVMGKGDFIGIWLAVKVAGQWVRWVGQSPETSTERVPEIANEGRRRFNRFLVGNALSIMAGVATWGALKIWALK